MIPSKPALFLCALAAMAGSQALAQSAAPAASPAAKPAKAAVAAEPTRVDATFRAWDADRNGALSLQEFRQGYTRLSLGLRQARLQAQFEVIDGNDDGGIDAGEYAAMALVKRAGGAAPAFASVDSNRNGRLDLAEYRAVVGRLATQTQRKPSQGKQQ
jgi:Ca2+-binding EF-hand superfamily protein